MDVLFKHFSSLNTCDKTENDRTQDDNDDENVYINDKFTKPEIVYQIMKLKNNKACGMDHIINEYLKNCPISMIELIVKLFNIILSCGIVPTDWCIGIIKPIYKKKGSHNDPNNYRGITLLSCLGKLFTAVINKRLALYVDEHRILGNEQAGFREGFSTLDHIFVLHSLIEFYQFHNKRVYCAFLDYKKAFDLLDRVCLWQKLISCNVNGKILKIIRNLYSNAKSCIKQENVVSELFKCEKGVRQGENLSPLLFALYLNDMVNNICKSYNGMEMLTETASQHMNDVDVKLS
jgi:hypothetical protein